MKSRIVKISVIRLKTFQESEERAEVEEMRERLSSKKVELEDMLTELNSKLDEGEEQVEKLTEEKKKLQVLFALLTYNYPKF